MAKLVIPVGQPLTDDSGNMTTGWVVFFSNLASLMSLTTTQTVKDSSGATKTITIQNGVITNIQ